MGHGRSMVGRWGRAGNRLEISWRSKRNGKEGTGASLSTPRRRVEDVSGVYVCMRVVCLVSKETLGRRAGLKSGVGGGVVRKRGG